MEDSCQTKSEWRKAQRAIKKAQGHYSKTGSTKRKIRAAKNTVVRDRLAASEAKVAQLAAENDELKAKARAGSAKPLSWPAAASVRAASPPADPLADYIPPPSVAAASLELGHASPDRPTSPCTEEGDDDFSPAGSP